jgi:hypothetical protein
MVVCPKVQTTKLVPNMGWGIVMLNVQGISSGLMERLVFFSQLVFMRMFLGLSLSVAFFFSGKL